MSVFRSFIVVVIIGGVIAGLTGYRSVTENSCRAEESVEKSFTIEGTPRIVVETFNGMVEVRTSTDARIEASVTKRATGSSQEAAEDSLDEIEVSMRQDGDTIRILARRIETPWNLGNRSASVLVQVPAGAILDLRTSHGAIDVVGTTGEIIANSSHGRIQIKGSRGNLTLNTSNGKIAVEGCQGRLEAKTSTGAIEIKDQRGVVSARTSKGSIRCQGPLGAGGNELLTTEGSVVVVLPAGAQFQVEAKTSSGRITSAFSVKTQGKVVKRQLKGQVGNNPTMQLRLETRNGSIDIRKG